MFEYNTTMIDDIVSIPYTFYFLSCVRVSGKEEKKEKGGMWLCVTAYGVGCGDIWLSVNVSGV